MTSEFLEGFPFRPVSDPGRVVCLNTVARGLLELFYLAVETGESASLLTWPSRVENVPVLHALAQLREIVHSPRDSGSESIRLYTIYWPWKQNSDIVQKRILVDRSSFVSANFRHVGMLWSKPQSIDYLFHMALHSIKDLDPNAENVKHTRGHRSILPNHPELIHPTLFEITPQEVCQNTSDKEFPSAKDNFLRRVRKYIQGYASLSDDRLFQLPSSPAFLLNIPGSYPTRDLFDDDIFLSRRPDVVLLNLTDAYSRIGKEWQDQVSDILAGLLKHYSSHKEGAPPAIAITEDIIVFNLLRFKALLNYEKQRRQANCVSHYAILNTTQSLFDEGPTIKLNSIVPSIAIISFSEDMLDVFVAGQDIRNKVKEIGSVELAEKIDILNHTLRNIINMPGGMDDYMEFLEEYCAETGSDIQFVAIKPLTEWTKVKELVEKGAAGAERIEAEEYLKKCHVIIDGLKNSTPLQFRLEALYQKFNGSEGNVVVFPNKQMKAFAEWMISNRMDMPKTDVSGENKFAVLDARQAFDLTNSLLTNNQNVYFVLPRQKYLSQMIAHDKIPARLSFICDSGTILSLLRYADSLGNVPGLEVIRPRVNVMREALQQAIDNRVKLLGELDETKLMVNSLIYNLREYEPDHYQGHPVRIETEEGVSISVYEHTDILKYSEENDIQPFSKVTVSQLQGGDRLFVITPEFLDAAADKINITAMASESLRAYHARIVERLCNLQGLSLREKAETIRQKMKKINEAASIGEGENLSNIERWIKVEKLLEMPRELVKPQAPKIRRVFRLFMKALDVSEPEADWYWAAAIQSTRKVRIRAGLDRNRVFYKLLLDPTSVEKFIRGEKADLRNLVDIACRNVFTVTEIVKEHTDDHQEC